MPYRFEKWGYMAMRRRGKQHRAYLGELTVMADVMPGGVGPQDLSDLALRPEPVGDEYRVVVGSGAVGPFGLVERNTARWLGPLLVRDMIRARISASPEAVRVYRGGIPLSVDIFLTGSGQGLLRPNPRPTAPADVLHESVRSAYAAAIESGDPEVALRIAQNLGRLAESRDLRPETHLLLALLRGTAKAMPRDRDPLMERVRDRIARVRIGDGIECLGVTVFPLFGHNGHEPPYVLLGPAIEAGDVEVTEVSEGGSVPHLAVINRGAKPVLLPEGEILAGAKQNRVVNLTVLVAARSKFVVPVSCVERGRWRYSSRQFRSTSFASPGLRARKQDTVLRSLAAGMPARSDQNAVWDEVDGLLHLHGCASPTSSLTDGIEAFRERRENSPERLELPEDACGILVARAHCVLGMDLFDSPKTFKALRERLSESYLYQAFGAEEGRRTSKPETARSFLDKVGLHLRKARRPLGLGSQLELSTSDQVGTALWYEDILCHLAAFGLAGEN